MLDTHEIAALGARRLKETADKDGDRVLDAGRASRNTELVARNLEVRRSPRPVRRSDRSSWLLHAARERERWIPNPGVKFHSVATPVRSVVPLFLMVALWWLHAAGESES